ncbi:MAG: hypothetical protein QG567_2127, partial [Campylobacterota bacterium]|nr:hypothetical protein [Campylobacterota bacterium]
MNFLENIESIEPKKALDLLQQRFEKNRVFFDKNLPHLGELLKENTKEFHLYIDSRGINIATNDGKILYPIENGKSTIFKISKKLSENLSTNPICKKIFNQKGVVRYNEPTIPITTKIVNEIVDNLEKNENFSNKSIYLGENNILPTLSVFGLTSGLQIEYIKRDYSYIHALFIYEPNIDFFIISNYFIDYEECYKKIGFDSFYLFVKGHTSLHVIKKFYASHLITNNYLRFEISTYEDKRIKDARDSFLNIQRQNTRGWGSIDDEMVGLKNRIKNIDPKNPKYPIFAKPLTLDYPICVVGNGPSLNELMPFIKENSDKMIIFSSGTALKPLKNYGIEPDFQIEIERRDHVASVLKEAPLGNTTLLAADIVDPSTLECAKKSLLFIRATSTSATMNKPKKIIEFSNPIVGNASVALALEISKNVLLCGLDVGFKGDGKQHAKGSYYDNTNDKSQEKIPTRGNFSSNIYTNSLFSLSREMFEHAIA